MTFAEIAPYLIPALATVIVAWIGLRPKRTSPEELMSEQLNRMDSKIQQQEQRIDDLEKKFRHLNNLAWAARTHIHRWEEHACANSIEILVRPAEIEELFKM